MRKLLGYAVGVGVLVFFLLNADLDEVHERFAVLGWEHGPLVLLPYLFISLFDGIAWKYTFPPRLIAHVPLHALVMARAAGEAVNSLTPTATVGGEPLKAQLLRAYGVSMSDGLASAFIAKTALTIAQIIFILMGMAALGGRVFGRGIELMWLAVFIALSVGFSRFMIGLQRRDPATTVLRLLERIMPWARFMARLESGARAIDDRLAQFYQLERGPFVLAVGWHWLGWMTGVVEVLLMMYLIGEPVSVRDALLIETLAQPIRAAALIVPGGLGFQEVGGVWLTKMLGVSQSAALSLWLLKRGRELFFDVVGLLYAVSRAAWRPGSKS